MALPKQVVTIDLGFGGIDQQTDPKRVIPTRLTDAYNIRFDKTGRISRRYGFDVLGTSSRTFTRLISSYDQIIGVQPMSVSMGNTWIKAANGGWSNSSQTARQLPMPEVSFSPGIAPNASFSSYSTVDSAVGANYTAVFAQTPASNMAGYILSNTSGKIVDSFTAAWTAGKVLLLTGDKFLFGGRNGAALGFSTYDASLATGNVAASLTVPFTTAGFVWDWAINTGGAVSIALGADTSTAISTQRLAVYVPDTSVTFLSYVGVTTSVSVAVASYGASAATATFNHSGTATREYHFMTVASPATLAFATSAINYGSAVNDTNPMGLVYSSDGLSLKHYHGTNNLIVASSKTNTSGFSISTNYTAGRYTQIGKPVWPSSLPEPVIWVVEQDGNTGFLFGDGPRRLLAKALAEQASYGISAVLPSMNVTATGITFATLRLNTATTTGGIYGIGIANVHFDQNKHVTGTINNQTYLTGGFLSTIEAPGTVNEVGALTYPDISDATSVSTGGNLPAGSYSIVSTLERYDQRGDRLISQVSYPRTLTVTTSTGRISVTSTYNQPSMLGDWNRKFYMTVASGTVYYSVTTSTNHILTVSNASEPLYTTGNVFENYQPSCPIAFATNGRRAICVEGDSPNFVLISKEKQLRAGLAFMQDIGRTINSYGAGITDLKSLNDKWIAFKERAIFAAAGEGPDDTGQNDTLSEFEPVSTSIGCINKRTSVLTNYGIVFMSERGFYMLDSSLSLQPIGLAVSDVVPTTVISGVYHEKPGEVHYLLAGGTTLVLKFFETESGIETRWSRNTNQPFSDMTVVGGVLNASLSIPVSTMCAVNQSTTYKDNQSATFTPYVIETAWIPMGSVQGFGRLYQALFIGRTPNNTSWTGTVEIGYDYAAAYGETQTIDGDNAGYEADGVAQWTVKTDRQKCEAVRFRFTMMASHEGMQFNQIQLVIGVKGGANKMRAEKAGV